MADIKSPEERSRNMSKIRSRNTGPEEYIRKILFAQGFRYRKNANNIPGHPDLWLAKYNTAIFVSGCYWHRHEGCKYAYTPKSRVQFWTDKFQKNIARDAAVRQQLSERGIRELVIWECTIRKMVHSPDMENEILTQIKAFLLSDGMSNEIYIL